MSRTAKSLKMVYNYKNSNTFMMNYYNKDDLEKTKKSSKKKKTTSPKNSKPNQLQGGRRVRKK